ncbi:homeobox protein NOBOX [Nothoprocta perdicaria]|nr:homeobox protein NOBOX [Nothoprocta perdicaria]
MGGLVGLRGPGAAPGALDELARLAAAVGAGLAAGRDINGAAPRLRAAGMARAGTEEEQEEERAPDGLVCKNKKEDSSQNTEHFVVDADPIEEHGTRSNVLPTPQSGPVREVRDTVGTEEGISPVEEKENRSYCIVEATASASQDSAALDCQLTAVCRQLPDFLSDGNAVPPPPVDEFAQDPTEQSGSCDHCHSYYSDGIEMETKKKKNTSKSELCPEKTSSVMPGELCRPARLQDVRDLVTRRSSKSTSANSASQELYKVSSVLEPGNSHDGTKEKKEFLENPEILLPVRKKSRTFYSAEQLEELEKMFQEDHYPDNEKRREIAAVVGVTPQRIMVWFQNRRAKWRKTEKLSVKGNKKHSASAALSAPLVSDSYRAPLLPVHPLPDVAQDPFAAVSVETAVGNYSSLLSGHLGPFVSSSASSVTGMVSPCEAAQTKQLSQGNFASSRMECFPSLPSPPPIRRANLPLSLAFSPHSHIVPLMLDTPSSKCSFSSRENGSMDTFTYSFQNQCASPPASCGYPEQLESAANLEASYCQCSGQGGACQLAQYPQQQQQQLSLLHRLPAQLPSNELSSIHPTPTASRECSAPFFTLDGNGGIITYGAAGATQGYVQDHVGGQMLLQQPSGSSGTSAYQPVPWNDLYMQGAPFSSQLGSRMTSSSMAGGHYFTEQISYTQPSLPSSPYFLQVPNGTAVGSLLQSGKPKALATPDQRAEPELTSLANEEVESSSNSNKAESVVDVKEETND